MNKRFLATLVCGVAVAAIGIWFVCDHYIPKNPPLPPAEGEVTEPTRAVQSELYLETEPSEWFALNETVNWNDQLEVQAKHITVSRTLPEDVDTMTEMFYYGFDRYQQIVDEDDNKLFLDITLDVTCIGLPSGSLFGVALEDATCSVAAGQMEITYYDHTTGQITEHGNPAYEGRLVAVQDLSGNHTDFVDLYSLKVGDTARFRNLYIIDREQWDNGTVLLTPLCGRYSAEQLQWLHWQQPHMVLNNKESSS